MKNNLLLRVEQGNRQPKNGRGKGIPSSQARVLSKVTDNLKMVGVRVFQVPSSELSKVTDALKWSGFGNAFSQGYRCLQNKAGVWTFHNVFILRIGVNGLPTPTTKVGVKGHCL